MDNNQRPVEIRDARRKQMYRTDNTYIDTYAKFCKTSGTAVYGSLCRHAGPEQECWPGIALMAEQHGITERTVIRALKVLEEWNIISITREKDPKTKRQMKNVYTLMDKSEWVNPEVMFSKSRVTGGQSEPGDKNDTSRVTKTTESRVTGGQCKEVKKEGGTKKVVVADATDPLTSPEQDRTCMGWDKESEPMVKCKKVSAKDRLFCKDHQQMNCDEFVTYYRKSNRRYIRIIAEYADEVKPEFETMAQWEVWANKWLRASKELEPFSDAQIAKAYEQTKKSEYITDFNLYTIVKFLLNTSKR